jgi:hypothetical protein
VNRDLKHKEGELAGMPPVNLEQPREELSISKLTADFQSAVENNTLNHAKRTALAKTREEIEFAEKQLYGLNARLEELQEEAIPDDVETGTLFTAIEEAETTNQEIREESAVLVKHNELHAAIKELQGDSKHFTNSMARLDLDKEDALEKAKFPIEGLSVDESGVMLDGIPLEQECDSGKLKVSMAIAMAINPELRVISITNGSLLDKGNMAVIEEMAGDKDFQVWIEVVDESGTMGIVIEDGSIKSNKG